MAGIGKWPRAGECTRHATVMTKRSARRRWILHWISSIRAFDRYVIPSRRLWRNQQCGKRAAVATTTTSDRRAPPRLHGLRLTENSDAAADTDVDAAPSELRLFFRVARKLVALMGRKKRGEKIYRSPHQRITAFIDFKTPRRNVRRLCNFLALVTPQLKITPILPRQRRIDATPLFTLALSQFSVIGVYRVPRNCRQMYVFIARFRIDLLIIFTQFCFSHVTSRLFDFCYEALYFYPLISLFLNNLLVKSQTNIRNN